MTDSLAPADSHVRGEPRSAAAGWLIGLGLLAVIGFGALLRWRLLDVPLDRDEGEFAYMAQQLLRGVPPYEAAYAMKLPGIYAVYASVMWVAGESIRGIHLGLLVVGGATSAAIFLLGRRLFDAMVGLTAAAAFALLSTMPSVHGSSAQAEQFVLLPVVLAWWLAVRAGDAGNLTNQTAAAIQRAAWRYYVQLVLAGVLLGIAITIKQHAVFLALATAVYVGAAQWRSACTPGDNAGTAGRRVARLVLALVALAVGAAIPVALMFVAVVVAGVWEKFWFWTVVVAGNYAADTPWSEGASRLLDKGGQIVKQAPLLCALVLCGFSAMWWNESARRRRGFVCITVLAAIVAICPGLHFRQHYFVLLLPALALLAALGGAALGRLIIANQATRPQSAITQSAVALVVIMVALLATLWPQRAYYFEHTSTEISRLTFGGNPFPEALAIAQRIMAHTSPDDSVLVLGSEPELLFYVGRRSATRYIYMYPLVEHQPYARQMQEEMIAEVEAARPAYLVFVAIASSWTFNDNSDRHVLQWFGNYVEAHYELDGCVDVRDDESAFIWGPSVRAFRPISNAWLKIYRRRN
jgi:hypothetical protein